MFDHSGITGRRDGFAQIYEYMGKDVVNMKADLEQMW